MGRKDANYEALTKDDCKALLGGTGSATTCTSLTDAVDEKMSGKTQMIIGISIGVSLLAIVGAVIVTSLIMKK